MLLLAGAPELLLLLLVEAGGMVVVAAPGAGAAGFELTVCTAGADPFSMLAGFWTGAAPVTPAASK